MLFLCCGKLGTMTKLLDLHQTGSWFAMSAKYAALCNKLGMLSTKPAQSAKLVAQALALPLPIYTLVQQTSFHACIVLLLEMSNARVSQPVVSSILLLDTASSGICMASMFMVLSSTIFAIHR